MHEKCALLTILELNWNQCLGQDKIEHLSAQLQKKVISRHGKNENVFKMLKDEKCTCKACKNTVFHCQICKFLEFLLLSSSWLLKLPSLAPREELIVFAYQIWKPQFLSVVQFSVRQLPFAVLSDNVFWNRCIYNSLQIEQSIWDESLLFSNCARSLEYSRSSTLAGLSYHICGKLEVAF